jgi:hypothetical protein
MTFGMIRVRNLALLAALMLGVVATAQAERPATARLLPEKTLAYLRIVDVPDGVAKFKETALGRIGSDEEVAPLVSKAYAAVMEAWEQFEDRVGVTLNELLQIPQGEICIALVDMADARPALVIFVDVKERLPLLNRMLDKLAASNPNGEVEQTTEMIEGTKVTIFTPPRRPLKIHFFEKEGTAVFTPSEVFLRDLLKNWNQGAEPSLADNRKFNAILSKCRGAKDEQPQMLWYVDPVEIARAVSRGNSTAQTVLALLPALGVNGILGVGGSMILNSGEYDSIGHFHLLLDSPRSGVLELFALGNGEVTPEPWAPSDSASYMTLHWKFEETYRRAVKLYNGLTTEGAFEREAQERIAAPLGLDFEKDLLPAFDGRITFLTWIEKPARINSGSNLLGLKLVDPEAFAKTLDKVIEKFADRLEKTAFGGVTYWRVKVPEQGERPQNIRTPTPVVAILGDYLIASDSEELLHHAIACRSDPALGLASQLDFKLIMGKIKRSQGGDAPSAINFSRPEEGLRLFYDLAVADSTRQALERQAENNRFFKSLDTAMKDHPLPPFAVIAKYLAPSGGLITNDETGIHWMTFSLRRK